MFKSKFRKEKNHTCCCSCNYIFQGSAYENASAVISRWTWQYFRYLNGASDGKSMALFKMTAILCCCPSWKTNPFPSVYVWAEKMKSFSLSRGSTRCWGQQRINLGGAQPCFTMAPRISAFPAGICILFAYAVYSYLKHCHKEDKPSMWFAGKRELSETSTVSRSSQAQTDKHHVSFHMWFLNVIWLSIDTYNHMCRWVLMGRWNCPGSKG